MKRKFLLLTLSLLIFSSQVLTVSASREEELNQSRQEAQDGLSSANSRIASLEEEQSRLLAEIGEKESELVQTIAAIDLVEQEIADKEAEIEDTAQKLQEAEQERDRQYEAMKTRICFLYENGGNDAWAQILLEDGNLSNLLSRAENTQQMYRYDRDCREEFLALVKEVADLKDTLEYEKSALESKCLENEAQKARVEEILAQKKASSDSYSQQLQDARAMAVQYTSLIQEYNEELRKIEEERKAEEARKQAEAEAKAKAEKEAEISEKQNTSSSKDTVKQPARQEEPEDDVPVSSNKGSATGRAIADYGLQFVGNPYVWGGESLTNGVDCSGFVMKVYEHFGYSLPHYTGLLRSCGRNVSYSQAQPGDIINYPDHVAIYIGNGQIVHASNSAPYPKGGIKVSSATYTTILSVRRIV